MHIIIIIIIIIIFIIVVIIVIIVSINIIIIALFHRFAHSAGPGMVPQRVEAVGSGFDGLLQSSK